MKTVEKMARAICEESGQTWESATESYRDICEGFALAALRALREPSEGMVRAGHKGFCFGKPAATFTEMIDSAIQEA